MKYFPGKTESSYTLFDDDRKSPTSLADGEYQLITFSANPQGKQLDINIASEGSYKGMPTSRQFTMEIPGVARPTKVTVNGTVCKEWKYNATSRTLTLPVTFDYRPLSITIL